MTVAHPFFAGTAPPQRKPPQITQCRHRDFGLTSYGGLGDASGALAMAAHRARIAARPGESRLGRPRVGDG